VIVAIAPVVSVLIHSIFRTGQMAITNDSRKREQDDDRRVSAREA
jgi:hypothetical protein